MHAHRIHVPPLHVALFIMLACSPCASSRVPRPFSSFFVCPSPSTQLLARYFLLASFFLTTSSDLQASSQIASLLQAGCPIDNNKELVYHLVGFSKGG